MGNVGKYKKIDGVTISQDDEMGWACVTLIKAIVKEERPPNQGPWTGAEAKAREVI